MSVLLSLAVFSSLSLNLIVQLGLGMGNIGALRPGTERLPLFQLFLLFLSGPLLWLVFSWFSSLFFFDFGEYFLLFPLSVLVCMGLERIFSFLFPKTRVQPGLFNPMTGYDGLAPAAQILTLRLAASFTEALVLSLGFSFGVLLSLLILRGIRKRSVTEKVPQFLRGVPLTLLSMGLLALIFSSLSFVFFKALGEG
jgi:electron transport complex protein RnfA